MNYAIKFGIKNSKGTFDIDSFQKQKAELENLIKQYKKTRR